MFPKPNPETVNKLINLRKQVGKEVEAKGPRGYIKEKFPRLAPEIEGIDKEDIVDNYLHLKQSEQNLVLCDKCEGIDKCLHSLPGIVPIMRKQEGEIISGGKACPDYTLYRALRLSGLPTLFRERNFDNFIITDTNKQGCQETKEFVKNYKGKGSGSLLIAGPTGVGKTHLAAAATQEVLLKGYKGLYLPVPELLSKIRAEYNDPLNPPRVLDEAKRTGLLVLDDLGAERITDWSREVFFSLINYRYDSKLPVIITTNLGYSALSERVGQRIISRLWGMCKYKGVIKGEDWRRKKEVNNAEKEN